MTFLSSWILIQVHYPTESRSTALVCPDSVSLKPRLLYFFLDTKIKFLLPKVEKWDGGCGGGGGVKNQCTLTFMGGLYGKALFQWPASSAAVFPK
jgi:hypothetical protein